MQCTECIALYLEDSPMEFLAAAITYGISSPIFRDIISTFEVCSSHSEVVGLPRLEEYFPSTVARERQITNKKMIL